MTDKDRAGLEIALLHLARRKYLYKSELLRLLLSCKDPTVTLEELETLLYSLIDLTVLYIDDLEGDKKIWQTSALLHQALREEGYEGLREALSAPSDAFEVLHPLYMAFLATQPPSALRVLMDVILASPEACRTYFLWEGAELLWQRLTEVTAAGHSCITEEERGRLTDELARVKGLSADTARRMVEGGLSAFGLSVSPTEQVRELREGDRSPAHIPHRKEE